MRYCARPAFASERLRQDGVDQPVRYSLTKPLPTGQTAAGSGNPDSPAAVAGVPGSRPSRGDGRR